MARDTQQPTLSQGNLIYLYQLLSRTIGCGKQTFITRVEEALDSDRMGADELGFASTRDLLEALDAFVTLTVFKGGRIYATVAAQPAWDEALAAAEKGDKATGASSAKPWKRKKGNRALKPIKPKRVKRDPEPTAEAPAAGGGKAAGADGAAGADKAAEADGIAVATASASDIAATTGSTGNAAATTARGGASSAGTGAGADDATIATISAEAGDAEAPAAGTIGPADADDTVVASADANAIGAATATIGADGAVPSPASDRDRKRTDAATGHSDGLDASPIAGDKSADRLASDAPATPPAAPEAAPAISLTVTYDPYSGIDEETSLVASGTIPQAPVRNDAAGAAAGAAVGAAVDTTARESTTSEQEKTSSPTPIVRPSARSAQPANAVRNGMPADAQSGTANDQQKPGATSGPQEPDGAAASHNMHAAVAPPVSGAIASPHATAAPRNAAAPHSSSDAATSSVSAGAHNLQAVPAVRDIAAPRSSSATATSRSSNAAAPLDARADAPARDLHAAPTSQNVGTGTDQNVRLNHPAPTEAALRSWPNSFSCDVYCPGEQVAALGALLPFGCDPHALLAADYQRARDLDLAWGTRGRVTFPLRIEHGDRTAPIEVTLQKRSGTGLPWGLTDVS